MTNPALLEVESEAAHAAVEAFFQTLGEGLEKRGLPPGAILELAETDHEHISVMVGPDSCPLAIKTTINFSGSPMAVQAALVGKLGAGQRG